MNSNPKMISVIVLSYNHENYISKCLDSILEQRVNAQIRVIVADDCSTDSTRLKIKKFQAQHPNRIILLETGTNLGHTQNYFRAWQQANGAYIAHCDGDDFWTNPLKLARQFDFLESHPNFSSCSHKVKVLQDTKYAPWVLPTDSISTVLTQDLLKACYPHNSSLFFRNRLFSGFPDFFFSLTGHDWWISTMNSLKGPIMIFDEPLATWRVRSNGLWGGKKDLFHLEHTRFFLEKMSDYLPREFRKIIIQNQARNLIQLAEAYLKEKDFIQARASFNSVLRLKTIGPVSLRSFFSLMARLQFPEQYETIRNLRNSVFGEPAQS